MKVQPSIYLIHIVFILRERVVSDHRILRLIVLRHGRETTLSLNSMIFCMFIFGTNCIIIITGQGGKWYSNFELCALSWCVTGGRGKGEKKAKHLRTIWPRIWLAAGSSFDVQRHINVCFTTHIYALIAVVLVTTRYNKNTFPRIKICTLYSILVQKNNVFERSEFLIDTMVHPKKKVCACARVHGVRVFD